MPKLWTQTIDQHRREVRDAVLETTAALVAERGVRAVTMSEIAEAVGIGRATLYKYFPDVESILLAWHERKVANHLDHLVEARDRSPGDAARKLESVLEAYAGIAQEPHGLYDSDVVAALHRDEQVEGARQQLHDLIRDLIAEGAVGGELRDDVHANELATYCLHAVGAAGKLGSRAAARRIVLVTLDALRPRGRD